MRDLGLAQQAMAPEISSTVDIVETYIPAPRTWIGVRVDLFSVLTVILRTDGAEYMARRTFL